MKTYFIEGQKVGLRPYQSEDFEHIHRWVNDDATTHYMFTGQTPQSLETTTLHYQAEFEEISNVVCIVEEKESGNVMGMAGLYAMNPTARKAEFRILLGDHRGKGLGTEITKLLVQYAFERLNLHRVYLGVTSANKGAIRAYEKAGFVSEGRLRDDIYRNGEYYDTLRYGIIKGGTDAI